MTIDLRKIDALVAEHVMGLRALDHGFSRFTVPGTKGEQHPVYRYTTDIAAAWLVVEKLTTEGLLVSVLHVPVNISSYTNPWTVVIEGSGTYGADTASLAICLTALKMRGIDV